MPPWSGHANRLNKIRTPGDGRRGGFETRPYRIVPTRVFLKDLRKLERNHKVHRRVVAAIERIAQNPHAGIRVRHKETGGWRWRVGDYRIRYDIAGKM